MSKRSYSEVLSSGSDDPSYSKSNSNTTKKNEQVSNLYLPVLEANANFTYRSADVVILIHGSRISKYTKEFTHLVQDLW